MSRIILEPPVPDDQRLVECLYCQKQQTIPARAVSLTCKFCNKPLKMDDLIFRAFESRRTIETCGTVTVDPKAQVLADRITCGHLVARGRVKANVTARGTVEVGADAELRGDIVAPSIVIGEGAVLHGRFEIGGAKDPK